jgi:uncharacterized membrane protein YeaQ/YmgE (transglycosylase-associated protein family)
MKQGASGDASMQPIFDAAFGAGVLSEPVEFLAYLVMGVLVGWLMARPCGVNPWFASLALMGVCGAWMGAEFAYLFGQAPRGGSEQFLAAMIGAGALAHAWRKWHPRPALESSGIAVHQRHA